MTAPVRSGIASGRAGQRVRPRRLAFLASCSLAAALVAVPATAGAVEPDAAAVVRQRLQLSPVLTGEFDQTKTLHGFRHPLVSHGEFLVARGQGVWWHTARPFESTLVVTPDGMFTRAPDGTSSNVLDAQAEPALRRIDEIVFALLAGDLDVLASRFTIVAQPVGTAGWSVVLTPRDPDVARFLASVALGGDRNVQTVRLQEARGDTTEIRFSHQVPAAALSPTDAARLR